MSLARSAIHICPCVCSVSTLQVLVDVFEISFHDFLRAFPRTSLRVDTGVKFPPGKEDDKSKCPNVYVQLNSRLDG